MTELGKADVEATVDIAADADAVYRIVTDLPTMADLAAENTSMQWVKGSTAQPGAKFKGTNSHGSKSWSTTCTVTDADPGRVFAFDVRSAMVPVAHWRYDIAPTGVKDRKSANVEHIDQTLQRLKAKAEASQL